MVQISVEQFIIAPPELPKFETRYLDHILDEMVSKYGSVGVLRAPRKINEIMYIGNGLSEQTAVKILDLDNKSEAVKIEISSLLEESRKEEIVNVKQPLYIRENIVLFVKKISTTLAKSYWIAPDYVRFRRGEQAPFDLNC